MQAVRNECEAEETPNTTEYDVCSYISDSQQRFSGAWLT